MGTTIKVSVHTRDRVNAIGAQTKQTADQVVERAICEYERALFWQQYADAADAVTADTAAADEEKAELALWERTAGDGVVHAE